MTQPQAVSEPTNQNDGNLPEIDKVLESSDNWLEYEPKTELGKVFYKWSQSNLPRHMPIEDWNRPWAVAHTQAFEQLLSQALTNARREERERIVKKHGFKEAMPTHINDKEIDNNNPLLQFIKGRDSVRKELREALQDEEKGER